MSHTDVAPTLLRVVQPGKASLGSERESEDKELPFIDHLPRADSSFPRQGAGAAALWRGGRRCGAEADTLSTRRGVISARSIRLLWVGVRAREQGGNWLWRESFSCSATASGCGINGCHNRLRSFASGHTGKMAASIATINTQTDSHVTTVTWEIKVPGPSR